MEGNLQFQADWASLIVGSKFTIFALFYFYMEGLICRILRYVPCSTCSQVFNFIIQDALHLKKAYMTI